MHNWVRPFELHEAILLLNIAKNWKNSPDFLFEMEFNVYDLIFICINTQKSSKTFTRSFPKDLAYSEIKSSSIVRRLGWQRITSVVSDRCLSEGFSATQKGAWMEKLRGRDAKEGNALFAVIA